jgi:endo-alpha-N-acetylgalactosaminidase
VPRQESPNGRVKEFEIRISDDGKKWGVPVAKGQWSNDSSFKHVALSGARARFVQLRGLSEVEGRPVMSAAELSIDASAGAGDESAHGPTPSSGISETNTPSPLPR